MDVEQWLLSNGCRAMDVEQKYKHKCVYRISKQTMNQQAQWNIIAERNRHNSDIPTLSIPARPLKIEMNGVQYYAYLSTNYTTVFVIFENNMVFRLPTYAVQKLQERGDQNDGVLSDFILILPNDETVIFSIRHFTNVDKDFAVLIKDEKYDYRTTETRTFYTPSSYVQPSNPLLNMTDVIPVKIYFCFDAKQFINEWNRVFTIYEQREVKPEHLKVSFPGKDNYIDNFIFNVQQSIVQSPELTSHRYNSNNIGSNNIRRNKSALTYSNRRELARLREYQRVMHEPRMLESPDDMLMKAKQIVDSSDDDSSDSSSDLTILHPSHLADNDRLYRSELSHEHIELGDPPTTQRTPAPTPLPSREGKIPRISDSSVSEEPEAPRSLRERSSSQLRCRSKALRNPKESWDAKHPSAHQSEPTAQRLAQRSSNKTVTFAPTNKKK